MQGNFTEGSTGWYNDRHRVALDQEHGFDEDEYELDLKSRFLNHDWSTVSATVSPTNMATAIVLPACNIDCRFSPTAVSRSIPKATCGPACPANYSSPRASVG